MIGNHLEPFKFWCQKVLPNVYDDSLSYYEYLCKLNEYLNEVIGQINTLTDNMEDYEADLTATWLETKEYIDNYFNNLDVQQEINNKLDAMATSGTLSTLIAPFVSQEIGGVVAEQIGNTVASQIGSTVANQIGAIVASQIDEPTATATNAWLTEHVDPVGSAVIVDDSLSISGAAADANVTGDYIRRINDNLVEEESVPLVYNTGAISSVDGSIVATNDYYMELDCKNITILKYYSVSFGSNYGIAFYDDNNNFISGIHTTYTGLKEYPVDNTASKVRFCWNSAVHSSQEVTVTKYITEIVNDKIANINHNLYEENVVINIDKNNGAISASNGDILPNVSGSRYAISDCTGWSSFKYYTYAFGSNYGIAFFDKNDILIGTIRTTNTGENTFNVPNNAVKVKYCWSTAVDSIQIVHATGSILKNVVEHNINNINELEVKSMLKLRSSMPILNNIDMYAYINGLKIRKDLTQNIIGHLGIDGNENHDSSGIIYNDYCYSVFMSNNGSGDNASSPTATVQLCKININNPNDKTLRVIAQNTMVLGSYTENGGAGSPNVYMSGTDLHILFAVHLTNYYAIMHCTYSLTSDTISSYDIVTLDGDILNAELINTKFNYSYTTSAFINMQANSHIAFDGTNYYIGLCWGYGDGKSIICKTTDFTNWIYETDVDFGITPVFELALIYDNGYLYGMQRPMYAENTNNSTRNQTALYGILFKYKISTQTFVDVIQAPNCSSRPTFFKSGNNIILITNPISRDYADFIQIDKNNLANSFIIAESRGGWNYPFAIVYNSTLYMLISGGNITLLTTALNQVSMNSIDTFFNQIV